MKKTFKILFSVVCTLFVLIAASCTMSADQMVEQYNGNMYEDVGNGMYNTPEGFVVNTKLIPMDVYSVIEGGTKKIIIDNGYLSYKWILEDKTTNKKYDIDGFYIVYIGRPTIELKLGIEYKLTLFAKNREGVIFKDSATIKVMK